MKGSWICKYVSHEISYREGEKGNVGKKDFISDMLLQALAS